MAAVLTDTFPRRAPYPAVFARLLAIGKSHGALSEIVSMSRLVFTVSNSFPDAERDKVAKHLVIMAELAEAFPASG